MLNTHFFSSPIGLGHATRDIAISQYLGNISMRFVSGNAASKLIAQHGFDAEDLYRPPPFEVKNGHLRQPLKWLFKYYSYYNECKAISSQTLEKYSPNLVISDEDFASLVVAQDKGIKTVLVTDILETNFVKGIGSLIEKRMNKSMKDIIRKCDLVIIPESEESRENIICVGPIVRDIAQSREELREKFSLHKKTIVVSIGGTNSGMFLIEKAIEVFAKLNLDADLIIVPGPSLNLTISNGRNLGFINNLHEVIFAADLIISLAGKSTIDESKHYGTPGIFIPIKGHFEQEENAKNLGYNYNDIFHLDKLIPEKLNEKRNPMPFDGARKAANAIRELF